MGGVIIQTQDLRFSTTAEGVSPVVLDGVNLEIEEGSLSPCWGITAPASPRWPSI